MELKHIQERVYAGVLGKLIGVYLGRPVEGWSYEQIRDSFDQLFYYVHRRTGVPLIVADDDISGTFGFFRALEDHGYSPDLSAKEIGESWLNYIIEDKTILWWGGPGRSTEHTAYLNLKNGISAPRSGSIAQNGRAVAEQIGAQIFIEGFAMCYPGDPEKTVDLVKRAASVSHDGMAVEAACHLAAMDALAFSEPRLEVLLDSAYPYVHDDRLKKLITDVREICSRTDDWRAVRVELDRRYGYHLYPGSCHVAPNHAMVLAALLCGQDDFQKSVSIAASAGWDTDCNAGNVGALNGIRLGLAGIGSGTDLRTEVADRLLVITSDGGEAVSDAVRESRNIVRGMCRLNRLQPPPERPRFAFEYPDSLQGFAPCPLSDTPPHMVRVSNAGGSLAIHCFGIGRGADAAVSTPTFVELSAAGSNYLSTASPSLYETQTITAHASLEPGSTGQAQLQLYVIYDGDGEPVRRTSPPQPVREKAGKYEWTIPSLDGCAILRMGIAVVSESHFHGTVLVHDVDWSGAPRQFTQTGILMQTIWDTTPRRFQMWTSSARGFSADMSHTFCISHTGENGLATLGTRDWYDYSVESVLTFSIHDAAGLVLRCRGHRQYYGLLFREGHTLEIVAAKDDVRRCLARREYTYQRDTAYQVAFSCKGNVLQAAVDGKTVLTTADPETAYQSGGCGYLIDRGAMLADGFSVRAVNAGAKLPAAAL